MSVITFLWTMLVLYVIGAAARLHQLAKGHIPTPTPGIVAFALFLNMLFVAWVVALLVRGACQ